MAFFGCVDRARWVWVVACVAGCGPQASDPTANDDTGGSGSTAQSVEAEEGDDSTTRSRPANPTADSPESTAADEAGATGSTGGDTRGDEPEVICAENDCVATCDSTVTYRDEIDGDECVCMTSPEPPGYVACDLPRPCEGRGVACAIQAVRYGVFGSVAFETTNEGDFSHVNVDVLGDSRARAQLSGWDHDCCGGVFVNDFAQYGHPRGVILPTDPEWDACLAAALAPSDDALPEIPSCLRPEGFGTACEGPLGQCPDAPAVPDPTDCAAACPMAGDGVCDEAQGTGLCADGCDPIDCACDGDTPGVCDEPQGGGTCPIASDADDCGL
jgi:hypothetical protein